MATINLRPWRQERKERLKNEFFQITGLVVVAAAAIWFACDLTIDAWITGQQARNQMLGSEIASLDKKVKEIQELKTKRADLIDRMKVIQGLQGTRPLIVHIFDELAKTIPDGVFYTKIERKGSKIFIEGTAESNQRVSTLMRSIADSPWFASPNLTKIVANTKVGEQGNDFVLAFDIVSPEANEGK
jgi:type IV pilus assembly protein PilN